MRRRVYAFVSLLSLFTVANSFATTPVAPTVNSTVTSQTEDQQIIDSVRAKHAPDDRLDLFEIKVTRQANGRVLLEGRTNNSAALADLRAAYYVKHLPIDVKVRLLPSRDDLKDKTWAIVKTPSVTVRDLQNRTQVTVTMGTPVRRLDDQNNLSLIQLPDGSIGEVPSSHLRAVDDTGILIWNRREKLIVTADQTSFQIENPDTQGVELITLPRGAVLRLERPLDDMWQAGLPDGRMGTLKKADVQKLDDFQLREESARRESTTAFMKKVAETAKALAKAPYPDGGAFLRDVFLRHDLYLQRDPDMLTRSYPKVKPGKRFDQFKPGDILLFKPVEGVTRAGISLGGSRYVAVPGQGIEDFRAGSTKARRAKQTSLTGAVRLDPGFLNDPCLTSTRSNPYWQAPANQLVPCRQRADVPPVR